MMKKYRVMANDDALKYEVVHTESLEVKYEHDSKREADSVCELMNESHSELLERVFEKTVHAWNDVTESTASKELTEFIRQQVFKKEHEEVFISIMSKELILQFVDHVQEGQS